MLGDWCVETLQSAIGGLSTYGVWAAGPSNVWVVGTAADFTGPAPVPTTGVIHHFDGCRWSESTTYTPGLRAVWGSSPNDVWFVGEGADFVHYDGTGFHEVTVGTDDILTLSLSGTGPNDVWAVGRELIRPAIRHWDGSSWILVEDDAIGSDEDIVDDVWAVAPNRVLAGTSRGRVLDFDGTGWTTTQVAFAGFNIHGIWSDGTRGWAVGSGAQIFRLDAGTWTQVVPPGGSFFGLADVVGRGDDVFAVGFEGRLLRHDGTSFVPDPDASDLHNYASVWLTDTHVWVLASSGQVLHRAR